MRYFLLSILLCVCVPGLFAQDVIEQGYGIELAPHYGSRRISAGSGFPFTELERQDSLETGTAGYGIGIVYTSRVNKIGFTTGLRYLETGYDVDLQSDQRPGSGRTFSQKVRARYLSVPFELNFYQDITEKDRMFFTLGVAGHLHLGTSINQTNFQDGDRVDEQQLANDPDQSFRSPVFSINTAVGFDRKFNDRWSLRVEPFFQFFLQGNVKSNFDQTNRNYYQLGTRVLVRRGF
ncbi:outer membrane beta-barrel protein [Neolewinella antarctica]|uniref:Outer membrane protein beta-barrel domain-containing protein n=1 Tax=Neolewinella antarctica TaxID=442734 RepID=A0ABX0XCV6_9BACT|nr:outer membrane beta-barrel protein [Neolewinella antarctica]NJC26744.1 hypothetical protein [Neolewinella antarctica]